MIFFLKPRDVKSTAKNSTLYIATDLASSREGGQDSVAAVWNACLPK